MVFSVLLLFIITGVFANQVSLETDNFLDSFGSLDAHKSLRNAEISSIVNGNTATQDKRFFAMIAFTDKNVFCGGAVISVYWVITAAHCISASNRKFRLYIFLV